MNPALRTSIAAAARRWSGSRDTPSVVAARTSCPPVSVSELRPPPLKLKAVLITFICYLIRASTGLALGYAALTTYLLIRVTPVPITIVPERGGAGEGEPTVLVLAKSPEVQGCH